MVGVLLLSLLSASPALPTEPPASTADEPAAVPDRIVDTVSLEPGQTLAALLYADDLPEAQVQAALGALAGVLDFRKTRSGDGVRIERRGGAASPSWRSTTARPWSGACGGTATSSWPSSATR